jgi:UDP-glucuronate 4-epimerase
MLSENGAFRFVKMDLSDKDAVSRLFQEHQFSHVVNLAAQAGVRYSIENPGAYVDTTWSASQHPEGCPHGGVRHLVRSRAPVRLTRHALLVHDIVVHPHAYAATKKANELMAHNTATF